LKIQHLAQIKQEQARPVTMGLRILPRFIFGTDHAYGASITGSGTEETVEAMTRDDMVKFHQTWFQPDNATIVVVGDITMDEAKDKLEAKLGDWEKTGDAPEKNLAEVDLPKKSRVYIIDKPEAQQSVILAGHVAPPTNNPDEATIGVMNHILGGSFTSRINMNLREDKHWSYGARSMLIDAQGQRVYFAYAPVQADKTKEAMAEINKELRDYLGKRPATADELEKAQKNRTLRLPGQFETKAAVRNNLSRTVRYGLPEDYMETYADKVRALTREDIKATAKDLVHPGSLTWVVIGDRSLIEDKVRSLGYGVVQVIDVEGNPVE
jgi:zinc protease